MGDTKTTVTVPAIVPILSFREGIRTIDWLCEAFGFSKAMVVPGEGDAVMHAELSLGTAMIMGGSEAGDTDYKRAAHPAGRAMLYVVLDEVDEHCARARAAGAEIVLELETKEYGGRDYTARDPEGNLWTFGTYAPELPS
jgi:uncharacterized glyoxalase superfamily protein PhnB